MHLLFFCPIAQAVWFASSFSLRVGDLPLRFPDALQNISEPLDAGQKVQFANLLWCLWKARNKEVFQGKKSTPAAILNQARAMEANTELIPPINQTIGISPIQVLHNSSIVLYDGSWDQNGNVGMGVVIYNSTWELVLVHAGAFRATHPFKAETLALLWALNHVSTEITRHNDSRYVCFGDCKSLVKAVKNNCLEQLPHWKTAQAVLQCVAIFSQVHHKIQMQYMPREAVQEAHRFANWARQTKNSFTGYPRISLMQQMNVQTTINAQRFTCAPIQ